MNIKTFIAYTSIFIIAPIIVNGASIERSLTIGSSGEDVKILQQILNLDPKTQISVDGPGSPGNETTFFGPRTAQAVINFQNIYKNEVLLPAGLSNGTGFVGSFTRNKLNSLLSSQPIQKTPESKPITVNKVSATTSDYYLFIQNGVDQTKLNSVIADIEKAKKSYEDYKQKSANNGLNNVVTLDSMSPSTIYWKENTVVTLKGKGFTSGSNTVRTNNMGYVANLYSNDGSTLSFPIQSISHGIYTRKIQAEYKEATTSTSFWVINQNGESQKITIPVVFDVQ